MDNKIVLSELDKAKAHLEAALAALGTCETIEQIKKHKGRLEQSGR